MSRHSDVRTARILTYKVIPETLGETLEDGEWIACRRFL